MLLPHGQSLDVGISAYNDKHVAFIETVFGSGDVIRTGFEAAFAGIGDDRYPFLDGHDVDVVVAPDVQFPQLSANHVTARLHLHEAVAAGQRYLLEHVDMVCCLVQGN